MSKKTGITILKNLLKVQLLVLLIMSLAGIISPVECSENQKTLTREVDPVDFDGKLLPELLGKPIENLRIYSVNNKNLHPITFQIDERYPNLNFYFNTGDEADAHKANRILDPQDKICFYIRDAGDWVSRDKWPAEAECGQEVKLTDPLDGGTGWIYVFYYPEQPPERNKDQLVWLSDEELWRKPELPFQANGRTWSIDGFVNKVGGR